MPKYPHLIGADKEIWGRFLALNPDYFDRVEYDVRVGEGIEIDPTWEPEVQKMATDLTQKRIDVVGYVGDTVWIIEVKQRAGLSAVGQLVAYKILYLTGPGRGRRVNLAIVTDRLGRDEKRVFDDLGVITWVV